MNIKLKLAMLVVSGLISSIGFAAPGDKIDLGNIPTLSPGHDFSISLSKLTKDKFYTITGVIVNSNTQVVDYRITTSYGTTNYGSIGDVAVENNALTKTDKGYIGHLTPEMQTSQLVIKNVRANNGPIANDHIELENISPTKLGSGIEIRSIQAVEQADNGEKITS